MTINAVILAGGKGTRLGDITRNIPKPMVTIDTRPLLAHQIELLRKYGITKVTLITGHLSQVIEDYFGDGSSFGVKIDYFVEKEPLGTTGGLKCLEHRLTRDVLVLYGDLMVDMDLGRLLWFHQKSNSDCTLVLHPNDHPNDSDLIEIDQDQSIIAFHPKPRSDNRYYRNLVNAGIYVMSPVMLQNIPKGIKADFGRDIFPKVLHRRRLYGYNTAEYIKDIGTPDRLRSVRNDYLIGKVKTLNRQQQRPAIFIDRDGVVNEHVGLLNNVEDFRLIEGSAEAIRKINNSIYLAALVTNQSVVARNLCSIGQLDEIHKKMETLLGQRRAKLDAVYYCPHHPDKGYTDENPVYKTRCACRKPETGMIEKAQQDFNIDLRRSFMIGDSARDILCGRRAGLATIGVRTGQGCTDGNVQPDYMFDDLGEAVNFILAGARVN